MSCQIIDFEQARRARTRPSPRVAGTSNEIVSAVILAGAIAWLVIVLSGIDLARGITSRLT